MFARSAVITRECEYCEELKGSHNDVNPPSWGEKGELKRQNLNMKFKSKFYNPSIECIFVLRDFQMRTLLRSSLLVNTAQKGVFPRDSAYRVEKCVLAPLFARCESMSVRGDYTAGNNVSCQAKYPPFLSPFPLPSLSLSFVLSAHVISYVIG